MNRIGMRRSRKSGERHVVSKFRGAVSMKIADKRQSILASKKPMEKKES